MKTKFFFIVLSCTVIFCAGCGRKPSRPSIDLTPKEAISFDETEKREIIVKDEKPQLKTKPVVDIDAKPELED